MKMEPALQTVDYLDVQWKRKVKNIQAAVTYVWEFLEEHLPVANTHGAEFISHNHWDKFIPEQGREELLRLGPEDLENLPLGQGDSRNLCGDEWLPAFLRKAHSCCLENLDVLSPTKNALLPDRDASSLEQGVISEAMSEKKIHEVGIMCETVSTVFNSSKADIVVDVGSGKGYLSCELARKYGMPVLGLDSIETNTQGAKQRDERLGKRWQGLARKKAKQKQKKQKCGQQISPTTNSGDVSSSFSAIHQATNCIAENRKIPSGSSNIPHTLNNAVAAESIKQASENSCIIRNENEISLDGKEGKPEQFYKSDKCTEDCSEAICEEVSRSDNIVSPCDKVSSIVCDKVVLSPRQAECSKSPSSLSSGNLSNTDDLKDRLDPVKDIVTSTKEETGLYVPVTTFVEPEMNLRQMLETSVKHLCDKKDSYSLKLLLTGLHTCGSLAVTTMRLFLQDPGVVGLCYVGCCYQLMEELISGSTAEEPFETSGSHFPLSQYGKQLNLHLGRNARNLASQSVHRIQASGQLQGGDFFWRALLDVLLRELRVPIPERIIGMRGLNKRSRNFKEYAAAALKKLKLSSDLAGHELLESIENEHKEDKHKMSAFFQFKLALAPAIESLILLDRYLFLLEQECVESVHLVQLFDPVTSPRCYGFIAKKKPQENHVS